MLPESLSRNSIGTNLRAIAEQTGRVGNRITYHVMASVGKGNGSEGVEDVEHLHDQPERALSHEILTGSVLWDLAGLEKHGEL